MIDHLLWAVPDLETGCRDLAQRTGVTPSPGGRHSGVGTAARGLQLEGLRLEHPKTSPVKEALLALGLEVDVGVAVHPALRATWINLSSSESLWSCSADLRRRLTAKSRADFDVSRTRLLETFGEMEPP